MSRFTFILLFLLLVCPACNAQENSEPTSPANSEKTKLFGQTGLVPLTDEEIKSIPVMPSDFLEDRISDSALKNSEVLNAEISVEEASKEISDLPDNISSEELVRLSWEASGVQDIKKLGALAQKAHEIYGPKAKEEQSVLTGLPSRTEVDKYKDLNDVATILFIRAEAYMNTGKSEEALVYFQEIMDDYGYAQAWDPRGWYWSVREKSQASIDAIKGKAPREEEAARTERTKPILALPGTENVVDYTKYGEFKNVGKTDYQYIITDLKGLADAVGEGIYPNASSVYNNPRLKEVRKEERLKGSHWDFTTTDDLEAMYFKWVTAPEPEGLKLFYIGLTFEKAGMYYEALKAYRALVVHFPNTVGWTYWQTPWYPAQAAIAKIRYLLQIHPELGLTDKWMKIEIQNGFDNDATNDVILTYPGKIIPRGLVDKVKSSVNWKDKSKLGKVIKTLGEGTVKLVQYENKHWQLTVDGEPYVIKGLTYAPTKIGQSPDKGTLKNWMEEDENNNGKVDGPYDAWVDKNGNNAQDADELVVGDFQLMKDMGVNTMRIYFSTKIPSKELLRDLFNKYGIRVIMGNFLGKYAIGSGASWTEGTDYENEEHKKNMLEDVKQMVTEFKDEPYILMWVLGNENNYGIASNADKKPEAFYKFTDEVAQWIKSVDANHPVAVNNGDTLFLDIFAKAAPNVDIFSANVYRGNYGFGSFWEQVMDISGRPAFITEYGCPAYAAHLTSEEAEKAQAEYHYGNWMDIESNLAGNAEGVGNALGGVVFEWLDEWWKNYEPYVHDKKSDAIGPFPGGYYFEEWFGIVGQGNGSKSPFLRHLRQAYFTYQELWSTSNETLAN